MSSTSTYNSEIDLLIDQFRQSESTSQCLTLFWTEEDMDAYVQANRLTPSTIELDSTLSVYELPEHIWLLWDQEWTTVELFRDWTQLQSRLFGKRQADDQSPINTTTDWLANAFQPAKVQGLLSDQQLLRNQLANALAIPKQILNYSPDSLPTLDHAVKERSQSMEWFFLPLCLYLGQLLLSQQVGRWVTERIEFLEGGSFSAPVIELDNGQRINIVRLTFNALMGHYGTVLFPSRIYRILTSGDSI